MVELGHLRGQVIHHITQTGAICQLCEYHENELRPSHHLTQPRALIRLIGEDLQFMSRNHFE